MQMKSTNGEKIKKILVPMSHFRHTII